MTSQNLHINKLLVPMNIFISMLSDFLPCFLHEFAETLPLAYLFLIFNPLTPRRTPVSPFTEISIIFYEGIIKKISYERHAYESADKKSLS